MHLRWALVLLAVPLWCSAASAQQLEIPRRHDRPPGPPLSAEEAVARMTVPEGFSVEIVAAEPDVVNPVAMFIDEKGRFWITESLEYPRREPGPGRDRVKVLEDTDGDGKVDKVTVFADGLNIPSGIAVGYGGVWVANSPDILFLQDTDGDLKADKREVIVTGFGRDDTHELPNSFTWGPDGWLYGLNGVFNYCHVKYPQTNPNYDADHPGWQFTCAMFRIHPRTREFQVFAEGTSNPWGIAINDEGDFFISACVIDHLWHIVETGYYIRQGGPYPPHTWPMRSIVDHKHQKAAYCGITWFDSDAYPEEYRKVLYMGNIHGGCINADVIERDGSTYKGKPHPGFTAKPGAWDDDEYGTIARTGDEQNPKLADFLTANDAWFMPVVQTTGPDGCLYILDWYDRYHCYQDANADPAGIERAKGRLYRVVYKGHQNHKAEDLSKKTDDELMALLDGSNQYVRETARRLLAERITDDSLETVETLISRLRDNRSVVGSRLQALWTLVSSSLVPATIVYGIADDLSDGSSGEPAVLTAWRIRALADRLNDHAYPAEWLRRLLDHTEVRDPVVQQQLIVAITKFTKSNSNPSLKPTTLGAVGHLTKQLGDTGDDRFVQQLYWQNLLRLLNRDPSGVLRNVVVPDNRDAIDEIYPRVTQVALSHPATSSLDFNTFLEEVLLSDPAVASASAQADVVTEICNAIRQKTVSESRMESLSSHLRKTAEHASQGAQGNLRRQLTILRAILGDADAMDELRKTIANESSDHGVRMEALETLVSAGDDSIPSMIGKLLGSNETDARLRDSVISMVGQVNDPAVASMLLGQFDAFEPSLRPKAIEVLTQRPEWSTALLRAIKAKQIDKEVLNLNQLRRVALFNHANLQKLVEEVYGTVRTDRGADRQQVINRMRDFLNGTPGDPHRGEAAFKKVCGQCHKLHGQGEEVGPDITLNGRNNWEQLLTNVFDPSAVIGPGYQARQLLTTDGRVLTGLPVEESDQRVVLKIQGGKLETIPQDEIELYQVSELSMMPEDLEKQLTPQEISDLFSFLALDKHPSDPQAKYLPGAPRR